MQKITMENVFDKEQHLSILDILDQYPDGLTLHELTYHLCKKPKMYNFSKLQERFGNERKNVFKSKNPRQRIYDCLYDLKSLNLVIKVHKQYKLANLSKEMLSLIANINILKQRLKNIQMTTFQYCKNYENSEDAIHEQELRELELEIPTIDAEDISNSIIEDKIHIFGFSKPFLQPVYEKKFDTLFQKIKTSFEEISDLIIKSNKEKACNLIDFIKTDDPMVIESLEKELNKIKSEVNIEYFKEKVIQNIKNSPEFKGNLGNIIFILNTNEDARNYLFPKFLRDQYF